MAPTPPHELSESSKTHYTKEMTLKKPRWLFFRLTGIVLIVGAIILGFFQFQWISSATEVEEHRILKEISISAERALDEAFDEIRALISFAYVTPENIGKEHWTDVDESIRFWSVESLHPDLLAGVMLVPAAASGEYLAYSADIGGFAAVDPPPDFDSYERHLEEQHPMDAYRLSYTELLSKGYFLLPIFPPLRKSLNREENDTLRPVTFLSVQIDTELLFAEILPDYLSAYLVDYRFKIVGHSQIHFSTLTGSESERKADVVVPLFGGLSYQERGALRSPLSRFWFLKTAGVPGIESDGYPPQDSWLPIPRLEVFYPDRSLESAMRGRQTVSLLLGIGTLLVLLIAYFVLYVLLTRTDKLRMRERDFVTSMSHELRTPLSVINATSDNLIRGIVEGPERIKRYGGLIKTQAQRLGKMVEGILLYSGIEMMESGRMRSETIHLSDFFEEIIASLAPSTEEVGAALVFAKDTHLATVTVDGDALRIIAENLIVNALRHGTCADGKTEIRITIRTRPPRSLLLTVEDDGPGIPQNEIKTIFGPFVRGERSKGDQTPGSGLGLHIVQRVCTQMGGHVSVESPYKDMAGMPKQGSRFTVKIPFRAEKKYEETDIDRRR